MRTGIYVYFGYIEDSGEKDERVALSRKLQQVALDAGVTWGSGGNELAYVEDATGYAIDECGCLVYVGTDYDFNARHTTFEKLTVEQWINEFKKECKVKAIDEMIAVMKSFGDGKKIKCRHKGDDHNKWSSVDNPIWDWSTYDYAVMEEPKVIPYGPEDVKFLMGKVVEFDNGNIGVVTYYDKAAGLVEVGGLMYTFEYLAEHAKDITNMRTSEPFGKVEVKE